MSKTSKQIGPAEGYTCRDMESFSNPKAKGNDSPMGQFNQRHAPAPTSAANTHTGDNRDQTVKSSASPKVAALSGGIRVKVGTNSAVENKGK